MIRKRREPSHVLMEKDLRAILSAIELQSPDNPWHVSGIRTRNQLIILMLLCTGLRIVEVLQIRINDIDFGRGLVYVGYLPGHKKEFPLPQHLLNLLHSYLHWTDRLATDHDYLFKSQQSGKQMTAQDLSRIFRELQEKVPSIPDKLTANAFRGALIKSYLAGIQLHTIQDPPIKQVFDYHKTGRVAANMKNFSPKMKKQSKKEN